MCVAQQISGHWKRLRAGIWPARMRACCAKPDHDYTVEEQSSGGALRAPRGFSGPRVIDAFMNMRCC
jgi:hypothetical protein